MNESYLPEKWKEIEFDENISENEKYQISTYGNIKSFKVEKEFGELITPYVINNYKCLKIKKSNGKVTTKYLHKLVAITFVEKNDPSQNLVIHLDYDKNNNNSWNLAWATKKESLKHQFKHPRYATPAGRVVNSKLTEGRVKIIKRKLLDPNRKTRLKIIARQFGVSEMQLQRIKTGENWGYVSID